MILAVGFLGISSAFSAQIFQNQIGFLPESQKQVVLKEGSNSPVVIKDQSGTEVISGTIMPEKDNALRYAIGKSVTATLNFAAVMALAADIYLVDYKNSEFSEKCATASGRAYLWAKANPFETYEQPADVGTGTYSDGFAKDEFIWAAAELYRISKNPMYLEDIKAIPMKVSLPSWSTTYALGAYTIALNPLVFGDSLSGAVQEMLLSASDDYLTLLTDPNHSGYAMRLMKWQLTGMRRLLI